MKARSLKPRELFDGKVTYEIPAFQRPYVWTEGEQWQPLWEDVLRVVESLLDTTETSDRPETNGHFLGAVVVKQLESETGDPKRASIIDGQQRLTTLQLLLDAAQLVTERLGCEEAAESLSELVLNDSKRFAGTPKRFKLWPSRVDRDAFEAAMDNNLDVPEAHLDNRIVEAHRFFTTTIDEWATSTDDPDVTRHRLETLAGVLQENLELVAIDLSSSDDDQLIFETLNDRGTPLLAADLIKNFVFQRGEEIGADVEAWSDRYWLDFDGDWWRGEIQQGRLLRSRIDLFLQYWLTMRTSAEVPSDRVFRIFRTHALEALQDPETAATFLDALRRDADAFRELGDLDEQSPRGAFYTRVVEALELGACIPLLLWVNAHGSDVPDEQSTLLLHAVESWAVRRTLLRRTMKDVNRFVVTILRQLDDTPPDQAGTSIIALLKEQTADSRVWPTDAETITELPHTKIYGNIRQQRVRAIFSALELQLRTKRHEDVSLPAKLDIEHVMPRGWRTYWPDGLLSDADACKERDARLDTIGNLTLVTKSLNSTLSNRPWRDQDAAAITGTGPDSGLGKRALLNKCSVLALTRQIVDEHLDAWTDEDIEQRSRAIAALVAETWPGP